MGESVGVGDPLPHLATEAQAARAPPAAPPKVFDVIPVYGADLGTAETAWRPAAPLPLQVLRVDALVRGSPRLRVLIVVGGVTWSSD